MMSAFRIGCTILLSVLLWGTTGPSAPAQDSRTLTIRDGSVYVDGRKLSPDQVPERLSLDSISAQYQFVGVQRPVVELNGQLYAIDDGLRPVTREDANAGQSAALSQNVGPRASARRPLEEAQAQYLNEMQNANRELYERLVRERRLEQQAQELARMARTLPDASAERKAKVDTLRSLLNTIFELKQENRRREIERLEQEIQKLQRSLQKRNEMRESMIDRRLTQLLNAPADR